MPPSQSTCRGALPSLQRANSSVQSRFFSAPNLLIFSGIVAALHLGKVAPAIPTLQSELGLSMIQAGFLLSLMQFAGASIGVILGTLTDTIGPRRSIVAGHILLCLASGMAVLAQRAEEILALRALESLGFLLVALPTPGLLVRTVTADRLAFRLALWGAYMPFGTATAFLAGPVVIDALGWRGWWLLPAGSSAICILMVLLTVPADSAARAPHATPPSPTSLLRRLSGVLKARNTWFIGIAYAMYSGQWIAIIGFLPTIYTQAGMTATMAGVLTATVALVNIAGNVSAGLIIQHGVKKHSLLLVGYLFLAAMTFLAFSQFTEPMPGLRFTAILLFSMVGGVIPATLFILVVKSAPSEEAIGTSVGWVQQLSSIGMLLMPPSMATLAGHVGGWQLTWVVSGIAALVGLALTSAISGHQ